jgi:uncharacterized protein YqeY
MSLADTFTEEMKKALKAHDKAKLSTIRLIRDAIAKKEIEQGREALDDDGIIKVVNAMARKSEEAIEQFKQGGRQDLVEHENAQLEIMKSFLPRPLSEKEIQSFIGEAIEEAKAIDLKDIGKVMKILMPKIAGKADGRTVNQMVRERLSG